MSTLEDKILGEKLHYYCSSSSEDEGNDSDESADLDDDRKPMPETTSALPDFSEWDGTSSNTGPKGVLKDWERFKELEVAKMKEKQREQLELIKKLAFTCRTTLDEEKDKLLETDPEMASLLSDDFLLEYQKKRMKEMLMHANKLRFGEVVDLETADQFLKAIDEEDKSVTVVVHIYENNIPGCEAMNGCLISLATDYPHVKFCKILGSVAGLSKRFKQQGVPALLVYKKGQIVGNFIQLSEHLGHDFYASDVENFLIENGILNDRKCVPAIISQNDSSDGD